MCSQMSRSTTSLSFLCFDFLIMGTEVKITFKMEKFFGRVIGITSTVRKKEKIGVSDQRFLSSHQKKKIID